MAQPGLHVGLEAAPAAGHAQFVRRTQEGDTLAMLDLNDDGLVIRPANEADVPTLTGFILEEAREAEGRTLDPVVVARGLAAAVVEGAVEKYWVLEGRDTRQLLGCMAVYAEWSEWCAAPYWWIQSFYVVPGARGRGLSRAMVNHLDEEARSAGAVELRLYVHRDNKRALSAYRSAGFAVKEYEILGRALRAGEQAVEADDAPGAL